MANTVPNQRNRTHCNCGQALVGEHRQTYQKGGRTYTDSRCCNCKRSRERARYLREKGAAVEPVTVRPAEWPQYRRWLKELAGQVIR